MEEQRELIWDERALSNLEKSLKRISQKSILQAEKVEQAILRRIEQSRLHPERNPPDKYKKTTQETTGLLKRIVFGYPIGIPAKNSPFCTADM